MSTKIVIKTTDRVVPMIYAYTTPEIALIYKTRAPSSWMGLLSCSWRCISFCARGIVWQFSKMSAKKQTPEVKLKNILVLASLPLRRCANLIK